MFQTVRRIVGSATLSLGLLILLKGDEVASVVPLAIGLVSLLSEENLGAFFRRVFGRADRREALANQSEQSRGLLLFSLFWIIVGMALLGWGLTDEGSFRVIRIIASGPALAMGLFYLSVWFREHR